MESLTAEETEEWRVCGPERWKWLPWFLTILHCSQSTVTAPGFCEVLSLLITNFFFLLELVLVGFCHV